jgi:hypothetical protein
MQLSYAIVFGDQRHFPAVSGYCDCEGVAENLFGGKFEFAYRSYNRINFTLQGARQPDHDADESRPRQLQTDALRGRVWRDGRWISVGNAVG